jgi:hypothetical protein
MSNIFTSSEDTWERRITEDEGGLLTSILSSSILFSFSSISYKSISEEEAGEIGVHIGGASSSSERWDN